MSLTKLISENFKTLGLSAVGVWLYYTQTDATAPWTGGGPLLPEWSSLVFMAGLLAAGGVLFAAGRIDDLLPEETGVFLQVVRANDTEIIETWELSEDQFEDMRVVGGPLNELTEAKHRAYECLAYNREDNVAVGTWRESKNASELVGQHEVSDALDQITELRETIEPEARRGREIRQSLPGILRALDRRRLEDQAAVLEPELVPSFGGDSIDDVIDAQLPEEAQPDRLQEDTGQSGPMEALASLVDGDDAEVVAEVTPATDGGQEVDDG